MNDATRYNDLIQRDHNRRWFFVENLPFLGNTAEVQKYGQKFGLGVECSPSKDTHDTHVMAKFFGDHDQLLLLLTDFFGREDAR